LLLFLVHFLSLVCFDVSGEEGFDEIRFAAYRTAAKLLFIQNRTNLHLADVFNVIEAFRENGLNTLDHNTYRAP